MDPILFTVLCKTKKKMFFYFHLKHVDIQDLFLVGTVLCLTTRGILET